MIPTTSTAKLQKAVVYLGLAQFGLHMAELNAMISYMSCTGHSDNCLPGMGEHYAIASSIYAIGGCLGSAIAGTLANEIGRRRSMQICSVGSFLGSLIMTLAPEVWVFSFGRLLVGVFAGLAIVIGPMFVAEVTPPANRQYFGMLSQLFVNFGIVTTQIAGYMLAKDHWRYVLCIGTIVSTAQAVGSLYIQESPIWLRKHNRLEEANHAAELLGLDGSENRELPGASESQFVSIRQFISGKQYRSLLYIVVGIFVLQQFSGINAIVFYGVKILEKVLSPENAAFANINVTCVNATVTAIAALYILKLGHKRLIVLSCWGMAIFTALLSLALNKNDAIQAIIAMVLDVAMFAFGLGPVPFMIISEIAPPEAVAAAQSVATVSNWLATFAIGAFFPSWHEVLGENVFLVFSLCAVIGGVSLNLIL